VVLAAFTVAVAVFGVTINRLFDRHGGDVASWIRWFVLGLILLLVLILIRRGLRRYQEIREAWLEMRQLRAELGLRPEDRAGSDKTADRS
jgi:hypothetical protein